MSFNPDLKKQAIEVLFSKLRSTHRHNDLVFHNSPVQTHPHQKHLGLILDSKLTFMEHLNDKIKKVNSGIGLIRRLRTDLPRNTLLTVYKSFIRPHLDYCDIIYDQPSNHSFCDRIESVQYNASLAITGCIRGTSRERIYSELGLESLADRRWCRRLVFLYKIINGSAPNYLKRILPVFQSSRQTRCQNFIRNFPIRTSRFKNNFFPSSVNQWNALDKDIVLNPLLIYLRVNS